MIANEGMNSARRERSRQPEFLFGHVQPLIESELIEESLFNQSFKAKSFCALWGIFAIHSGPGCAAPN
jgi:hypothetical protein